MSNKHSIVNVMFGQDVIIESDHVIITGILLGSKLSVKTRPHEPEVLIIEKDGTKLLLRGWSAIKTKERIIAH